MGKPSAPKPPDPKETAAAQTGTNVTTALANNLMGMVNENTPYGGTATGIRGWQNITDPTTGETYRVPQFQQNTWLNPKDQQTLDNSRDAQIAMSATAAEQGNFLKDYLGQKMEQPGDAQSRPLPEGPSLSKNLQGNANLVTRNPNAPDVKTDVRYQKLQNRAADGGDITRTYGTDFSKDRRRVENAMFDRINKQSGRDLEQLRTRLANQGIGEGSEAYSNAMDDFNRGVADSRLGAVLAGGQEQSRLAGLEAQRAGFENAAQQQAFGQDYSNIGQQANLTGQQMNMNLARAGFMNQAQQQAYGQDANNIQMQNAARQQALENANGATMANNQNAQQAFNQELALANASDSRRQQAMQEQFAYRNQPINEITALLSGSQVQSPNFNAFRPTQLPTVDYAGLVNNNFNQQMAGYNQEMNQYNSLVGGLFGLGSAGIMASDIRVKKNIRQIGQRDDGLGVYQFEYITGGGPRVGLMAQEVEQVYPAAVMEIGGVKHIDMGAVQ